MRDNKSEAASVFKVAAPRSDINAGENDLAHSAVNETARARNHALNRNRTIVAARERNRAESTAMVAAVLNLQKGARRRRRREMRLKRAVVVNVVNVVNFGAVNVAVAVTVSVTVAARVKTKTNRKRAPGIRIQLLAVDKHGVNAVHLRPAFGGEGRRAARHHDLRAGIAPPQTAQGLAALALRLGRHRAGVHHQHRRAETAQVARDHRALPGVEAAAERFNTRGGRGRGFDFFVSSHESAKNRTAKTTSEIPV